MGTSGSFGGSGGKDAKDLRDNIAAWLDGGSFGGDDGEQTADNPDGAPANPQGAPGSAAPTIDLGPAVRLLFRSRGGSGDGPGGGGGGAGGAAGGGGRSSGGVTRSVGRISRAAGRAGRLALAYSAGDRAILRSAGLNYDELRALGDPVAIGIKIVEAAFEAQADSTLADAEERDIVADVVAWILEQPADRAPSPEEVVRKTIETTIAETALTEISSTLFEKGASRAERQSTEQQIRDVAAVYAAQADLSSTGATEQEMATAIETGIRDIGMIFGVHA
ncbi:hypothetical protein [Frigoribacterium sp. Leaf186]|uniref:hypothetical protein n=1 Tax=Frigoribacterium sp. Leaf186 TaxID=1736293 RepID=UPI0006FF79EA|nr:hypothetical protein [Frigoribacterium sp. Leaf186]KQS22356.1 hypothetical protein ASG05_01830 [Frigoribacterium sp. Leaf186]